MSKLIFTALTLSIFTALPSAQAARVKAFGDGGHTLFRQVVEPSQGKSVSEVVKTALEQSQRLRGTQYQMSTDGKYLESINGLGSTQKMIDDKIQYQGWCYQVDGQAPTQGLTELNVPSEDSKIAIYYGYVNEGSHEPCQAMDSRAELKMDLFFRPIWSRFKKKD